MTAPSAPRLILHIGQHKTGSKALQSFLAANRERLAAHGILYPLSTDAGAPSVYRNSHFKLYTQLCNANHHSRDDDTALNAQFDAWERERIGCGAHTVLLSSEDLFDMQTAHTTDWQPQRVDRSARRISKQCRRIGWSPTLAVYLRRPDALLDALYAQYIKGHAANQMNFDAFHRFMHDRLDAPAILERWTHQLPESRMVVRAFEEGRRRFDIVDDFLAHVLGIPSDARWHHVADTLETANVTPDLRYILLLQRLNAGGWQGLITSRVAVLELAFRDRAQRRHTSFLHPEAARRLIARLAPGFDAIARRYLNAGPFFSECMATLPAPVVRLGPQAQATTLARLLAHRLIERIRGGA